MIYICRFDNNKVRVSTRGDWFYASTNGGITGRAEGRFYLNIIPEHAAELFGAIGRRAAKNGLHIEMKIPVDGDIRSLLRSDYYVIYCLSAEEGQLLSLLDEIHALTARSFRGSISRFCLPVKNAHGKVMEGVGFGEEPRERNVSFAGERAAILAEVLAQARSQGVKIYEDSFDIKAAYTMACIQHGVDPVSPAFNLRRWSLLKKQRFPILKGQYK